MARELQRLGSLIPGGSHDQPDTPSHGLHRFSLIHLGNPRKFVKSVASFWASHPLPAGYSLAPGFEMIDDIKTV